MGNVLLIGGAGFIGSHIAERLVEQGKDVSVYDNWRRGKKEWLSDDVCWHSRDVRLPLPVDYHEDYHDSVVNLASILIHESHLNPKDGYDTNTIGALNAYLFARSVNAETFVQFSSASVYGEPREVPTSEWTPRCPTTAYGYAKMDAEDHLMAMKYGGPQLVMLRPYNVYGRRQSTLAAYTEVLPRWAEAVWKNEPIVVHGDGSQTMDLIHVTDVARFVTDFAITGKTDPGVYNVGSGVETSVMELARACQVAWDAPESTIVLRPYPNTENRQKRRCADITCAKAAGWTPEVKLEDGLADYWEWWQKEAEK